jgi:hypothetical protein
LSIPKQGERYVVRAPFEAIVMTHWQAPFTGGAPRVIPAGIAFTLDYDLPPMASAIGVTPEEPARWEAALVDEDDRRHEKYGGYSISVPFDLLARHCERID